MTKTNRGGGAPKQNRNAANGDTNRVTLAVRVTPEAKARIKATADNQGISMGDLIDQWAAAHAANRRPAPATGESEE
jgi:hypothetical protein